MHSGINRSSYAKNIETYTHTHTHYTCCNSYSRNKDTSFITRMLSLISSYMYVHVHREVQTTPEMRRPHICIVSLDIPGFYRSLSFPPLTDNKCEQALSMPHAAITLLCTKCQRHTHYNTYYALRRAKSLPQNKRV